MFLTKTEIRSQAKSEIDVDSLVSNCNSCKLNKGCLSPMMKVTGLGEKKILIIGDVPSAADDKNKMQFSGETGKYLSKLLFDKKISLQRDCWKVNAVRCNNVLKDLVKPAGFCSGYIKHLLYTLKPDFVLILGNLGIVSLFGSEFKHRDVEIWRGFKFYDYTYSTSFFCTYHPREIITDDRNYLKKTVFEKDINRAIEEFKKSEKITHIDYNSRVEHLLTCDKVVEHLTKVLIQKPKLYFDYETSGLKPYRPGHFLASIAFATSPEKAYAFPFEFNAFWTPKELTKIKNLWCQILADPSIKKIGHNTKYEDVFASVILKTKTEGWLWDTMMAAHILDNRRVWTNLKFQTFINFGILPYNKHMKEFIESDGEFNRVHKAPLKELLTYNGLDCIFGYMLFNKQKNQFAGRTGLINANSFFLQGTLAMGRIQQHGITADESYYRRQNFNLSLKIKKLKRELTSGREARKFYEKFRRPINIASGPDLGKLFYEILGAPPVFTGNTNAKGENNYKTDKKTLEKLKLPFVEKLLELKKLVKAKDTYFAQFFREIRDNMMYPFFDLNTTVSYRSSSSKPNWQNLPKRDDYIMKLIRSGIIPRPRRVLSEIDFSGAEVITSSSYHKDPTFIAYLKNKSTDMHRDQALDLWKLERIELENPDFTSEQKSLAKKIRFYAKSFWTFAQFYGDWYDSCGTTLWETCIEKLNLKLPSGKTLEEHINSKGIYHIEDFIEHCKDVEHRLWNEKFPIYTKWKKNIVEYYRKNGYIETYMGFRYIGYMDKKQCTNYQIQGTSFHLLLDTLLEVEKFIAKNNLKTIIIGQIHDSIISDVPVDEIEIYHRGVSAIVSNLNKKFKWMTVEMEAECSISLPREKGGNFAKLYDIKPKYLNGTSRFNLDEIYELKKAA